MQDTALRPSGPLRIPPPSGWLRIPQPGLRWINNAWSKTPPSASLRRHQGPILIRPAVAEELPCAAHLGDLVEVQVRSQHFVLVAGGLGNDLAARAAKVTGTVELADVPRGLGANAMDGGNKVAVGGGVRGLLQFPKVLAQAGHGGRGVKDDLRAVQSQ